MKRSRIEAAWRGQPECQGCSIRDLALFADLQQADFNLIHLPIDEFEVEAGSVLYNGGDEARALLTLRSGLVKLVQYLSDGSQRIVRLQRPGDTLGLEATVGDQYEHTAVALRRVLLCRIPVEVIHRLSQETPRLHRQLMMRWHNNVRQADTWLTALSTGSAKARVARFLLDIPKEAGADGVPVCELLSREDIGAMLGVTTETASRMIADLKRSGVITERKLNTFVCNEDALRVLAGE
ncbi:Crp/Fnr family transcriptional regulator [Pararhodospirillum oryzae]|uniref:Crp/Fnr family transcriptional regulator n=1 Tax=Pararhodospirillum oryzae TaxID=478448 RepID=A0A512HB97_9PROT|nr:Crp/Fnr family transcriptional regulator [Pararhodospirillum oryzae]GEO82726.1 Crp/Fnr family transcriptional regulator [Pararhodospirillum oryzae]